MVSTQCCLHSLYVPLPHNRPSILLSPIEWTEGHQDTHRKGSRCLWVSLGLREVAGNEDDAEGLDECVGIGCALIVSISIRFEEWIANQEYP